MMWVALFCVIFVSVNAQRYPYDLGHSLEDYGPKPYSFDYTADAIGGSSSRQEVSDGTGTVTGSYTIHDEDGRVRIVEYIADENGFRANVKTNEPGTQSHVSADAVVESDAPVVPHDPVVAHAPVVRPGVAPVAPAVRSYASPYYY